MSGPVSRVPTARLSRRRTSAPVIGAASGIRLSATIAPPTDKPGPPASRVDVSMSRTIVMPGTCRLHRGPRQRAQHHHAAWLTGWPRVLRTGHLAATRRPAAAAGPDPDTERAMVTQFERPGRPRCGPKEPDGLYGRSAQLPWADRHSSFSAATYLSSSPPCASQVRASRNGSGARPCYIPGTRRSSPMRLAG